MTTIISYRTDKKVYMLGDTEVQYKDDLSLFNNEKIIKHKNILIGMTGSILIGQRILNVYLKNNVTESDTLEFLANKVNEVKDTADAVTFMVAFRDNTYIVSRGGYLKCNEQLIAIGSGTYLAYGAYEAINNLVTFNHLHLLEVMNICKKRNPVTGGNIEMFELTR